MGNLIDEIKDKVKISDILPSRYTKTIDCPCCKRNKKASIINNEFVYCFSASCNFKADVIALNSYLLYGDKNRYKESIKDLIVRFNIKTTEVVTEEDKLKYLFYRKVNNIYINDLTDNSLNYLINRGINKEVIKTVGVGYATGFSLRKEFSRSELKKYGFFKDNKEFFAERIIFPLISINNIESFVGRYIGLPNVYIPRYKNLQTSINTLILEQFINIYNNTNFLYIAEGFIDTLSLYQLGLQSVGILGVQGLLNHSYKLKNFKNICFCFDSDKDEFDNYKSYKCLIPQIIDLILINPQSNYFIFLPKDGKDINELLSKGLLTKELIEKEQINFIDFLTSVYIKDYSKHIILIKLIEITNSIYNRQIMYNQIGKQTYDYVIKILDFYESKNY